MLDFGPCIMNVKNLHISFNSPEVFITSNAIPDNWYKDARLNTLSLWRRFDQVIVFTKKYDPPQIIPRDPADDTGAMMRGACLTAMGLNPTPGTCPHFVDTTDPRRTSNFFF